MSTARKLLDLYRHVQYAAFRRTHFGVMEAGKECHIEPFKQEINHGDVVHPCVRFISEGYEGHKWWMVYTPYYKSDPSVENPILCYSESNEPLPPTEWKVYCEVAKQPEQGYNSDPTLIYTNGKLYVLWREYDTPTAHKYGHKVVTVGGVVKDKSIQDIIGPVVWSDDCEIDAEVCPTFVKKDGHYHCLAMHLKFHLKWIKKLPKPIYRIADGMLLLLDLLGIYSQQKSKGVAIWESDAIEQPFCFKETIRFKNRNRLYRPWHMDLFEYGNKLYSIVQTNKNNADICLAWSDDGKTFSFFNKPLITNKTIGKLGIYKPCAGVIDGVFYLYYTAQDPTTRCPNALYVTETSFSGLCSLIQ